MKTTLRKEKGTFAGTFFKKVITGVFLMVLFASGWAVAQQDQAKGAVSKKQQQRLDLMKSRGIDASMTILQAGLAGKSEERLSELLGLLLEKNGLKIIELAKTACTPVTRIDLKNLADSVSIIVKKHPISTEYALYAEMNDTKQKHSIDELRTVIVDKAGEIVWTDLVTSEDEVFKNVSDPDPMGYSLLLMERVYPQLGLNEETAKSAKPGKMEAIMSERSGLPPDREVVVLPERQKILRDSYKKSTLMVFPLRTSEPVNVTGAKSLVTMINDAGLIKAVPSKDTLFLKSSRGDPNEMKVLWNAAREFREYLRKNPKDADYFLMADYVFNPQNWMQGYVHFVVCDRQGDWVIADLQNSNHTEYRTVMPVSGEDCNKVLIKRLANYLKYSIADALRETIQTSGLDAGLSKFNELRGNTEAYYLSEDEMNALGYEYLMSNKLKEAIAVFKLNTEAFPESFNVYDSLGEAYAAAGEKELAIKNYEKSVELNPKSQSGIDALKKLKSK